MIGDVIQTTALVADLRRAFPEATLSYMTGPGGALVVSDNADLSEVVEYIPRPAGNLASLRSVLRQLKAPRRRRFDVGICLNPDTWDALLLGLVGVAKSVGFVEPGREFLLDQPLVWDEAELKARQARFDEILQMLGLEPTCRHYTFPPPASRAADAAPSVPPGAVLVAAGGARNPAGCGPYRQWLADRWVELLGLILDQLPYPVVLIGDNEDLELSRRIVAALPAEKRAGIQDVTGQTSLAELARTIASARLLVTNDSAPVWIAAAMDCPTVAIFGCNHPVINVPLAKWYAAVSCDLPCHPCYRGDSVPTCPVPPACVSAVTVSQVWDAVRQVLEQSSTECCAAQEAS